MALRGILMSRQVQVAQALANVAIAGTIRDDAATSIWSTRVEAFLAPSSDNNESPSFEDARPLLPRHVFVCVHGLYGKPQDSDHIAAALSRAFGSSALVYQSAANTHKTHLGVRAAGTKLAIELLDLLHAHRHPEATSDVNDVPVRISFVGHSLGGIISRYALVYLQTAFQEYRIHPTSFTTLCTPHLGSRRPGGTAGKHLWKCAVHGILSVSLIYGQTGVDMLGEDHDESPLLELMSQRDSLFMKALDAFDHRTAVAMIQGDHIVPYASAAIQAHVTRPRDDLVEPSTDLSWHWTLAHSGFSQPSIFASNLDTTFGATPSTDATARASEPCAVDERCEVSISATMLAGLNSVPWRRLHLHVNYSGVCQWYWLSFHTWPLGIQLPATSRSAEFIELFVRMLEDDHSVVRSSNDQAA